MHSNPIKDQINEQKTKVKLGSPKIEIIAPCIVNDGIIALNSDEKSRLITLFDEYQKELLFFIFDGANFCANPRKKDTRIDPDHETSGYYLQP